MVDSVTLAASPRTVLGKKVRALRREGIMPIHVYGPGGDPLSLQAPLSELRPVLNSAGRSTPVVIRLQGDGRRGRARDQLTLVREITLHPVTGELQHVDFIRVDANIAVEAPVPITLEGEAPGLRGVAGAAVTQGMYELTVRARPYDVPSEIVVDVSALKSVDAVIRVGDIRLPEGVEPAGDPEAHVAWIHVPRVSAAAEAEEAEEAEAAEVEEAEGEAAAEETPAEEAGEESSGS